MSLRKSIVFLCGLLVCSAVAFYLIGRALPPRYPHAALVTYNASGNSVMRSGVHPITYPLGELPLVLTVTTESVAFRAEDFRYSAAGEFSRRSAAADVYEFSVSINGEPSQSIVVHYSGEPVVILQHSGYTVKLEDRPELYTGRKNIP